MFALHSLDIDRPNVLRVHILDGVCVLVEAGSLQYHVVYSFNCALFLLDYNLILAFVSQNSRFNALVNHARAFFDQR